MIDLYIYRSVTPVIQKWSHRNQNILRFSYWGLTIVTIGGILIYAVFNSHLEMPALRNFIMFVVGLNYIPKLFTVLILFGGDIARFLKSIGVFFKYRGKSVQPDGKKIPRSEFLVKTAIASASIPIFTLGFGILSGAYDYRIRRVKLAFKNLPSKFDGFRIGQISDIHSGSFFNPRAVLGGVEMLNSEKPDAVMFTGDLVNVQAGEVKDYIDIFNKVEAPHGKFSILGNHDYGDYRAWPSFEAKQQNLRDVIHAHRLLDWDLLLNENRKVTIDGESIAVIGVENWGRGRFSKYGNLDQAYHGTEDSPFKVLLSHDPSHWDAQVRPMFPEIDLTLSGHTHGFQFGVEIGNFKWSPAQYAYKQWAGAYSEGDQTLYVNRGYGFIGYPGRIGIPPEITIIELQKA